MRSGIGMQWLALGVGLAVVGCAEPDLGEGEKIGRYRISVAGEGFVVHESSNWMSRLFAVLFGQTPAAKVRVGTFVGEPNDLRPDQIAGVTVSRRKLVGPAAKPTAMKMPWAVRFVDPAGAELAPFFHFRKEAEARRFAAAIEQRLPSP